MNELIFITSNNEKLAHVRYISRDYDIFISKQKFYGVAYKEPRVRDRTELFEKSIKDARERWNKNVSNAEDKFFFIEDTSVNIPVLAKSGEEFPGVDIKYWMKQNDFFSIDEQIKKAGKDRTAIVRSDVALIFSKSLEDKLNIPYKIFTSQIKGKIAEEEIYIKSQPYFCWLNDKTFNKWFIPDSCNLPLSALPISIADKYDFRKDSILSMLQFLKDQKVIKQKSLYTKPNIQLSFFLPPIFIITGPTCAGKTTIAEFLLNEYNYYHLEASDFMYVRYHEHHGNNSSIKIADFAEKALKVDPGIVVDQLNRNIRQHIGIPKVITGLRSPLEIAEFIKKYNYEYPVEVVYIEASFENRFKRTRLRNRDRISVSREEFKLLDDQQQRMGLKDILSNFQDSIIENNLTKNEYYKNFLNKYGDRVIYGKKEEATFSNLGLEDIIILTLLNNKTNEYYTTTQISHLIEKYFPSRIKNKNNISRYFNQNYYPYYEIVREKGKNKYRLSQTGLSRANFLKNKNTV